MMLTLQFSSLGYVHWPERANQRTDRSGKFSSLGYVHWPESKG